MRCPDCNKFVSATVETEPEVESIEVEETDKGKGLLRMTITLSKVCAECETQLATKEIELATEIDLTGFEEV